jgi:hypothetical protein
MLYANYVNFKHFGFSRNFRIIHDDINFNFVSNKSFIIVLHFIYFKLKLIHVNSILPHYHYHLKHFFLLHSKITNSPNCY